MNPIDITSLLKAPLSKVNRDKIIQLLENDLEQLSILLAVMGESSSVRMIQNSSWAYTLIAEKNPESIVNHHAQLISLLLHSKTNTLTRNIVRLYQYVPIPKSIESELYDFCYQAIGNPKTPIAIMAFSMTVCYKITQKYPELVHELILAINTTLPYGSAGIRNRGQYILDKLEKMDF